ncbi:MAG: 2Fe-2S iron-sulfur cluster-binding protein [Nanoarchaeota archaeon]
MKKYIIKLEKKIKETNDVVSLCFGVPDGFSYKAGQDVLVSFPDNREFGGKSSIPLSISSAPEDDFLRFTVRSLGEFSTSLHSLVVDEELSITKPLGETYTLPETDNKRKYVMIAGGTGITPFLSIIRHFTHTRRQNKIFLFYSSRSIGDIIFYDELNNLAKQNKNLSIIHTLTRLNPKVWSGKKGRITKCMVESNLRKDKYVFLLSGPPEMIHDLSDKLSDSSLVESLMFEKWEIPGRNSLKEDSKSVEKKTTKNMGGDLDNNIINTGSINTNRRDGDSISSKNAVLCDESSEVDLNSGPILDAAEKLGVPFGCRNAICGTCEVIVVEGLENLEPKNEKEKRMKLPKNSRLCCQAKIKNGRVKIDW